MKKLSTVIFLLLSAACGQEEHNSPPSAPMFANFDGTYSVLTEYSLIIDGNIELQATQPMEIYIDQKDLSVNFWGIMGQLNEDHITFDSAIWRRFAGGTGQSSNLYLTTFTGEVTLYGGELLVEFEVMADGKIVSRQARHFVFAEFGSPVLP